MKRFISLLLAGMLVVSIPGAALANDMTQTEDINVLATVACVADGSANYVLAGGVYELNTEVRVISTNNATGITITGWVTDWTRVGGGATVSRNERSTYMTATQGTEGTLVKDGPILAGNWPGTSAAAVNLGHSSMPVTGAVLGIQHSVPVGNFTVSGHYTATANYSCIVNN